MKNNKIWCKHIKWQPRLSSQPDWEWYWMFNDIRDYDMVSNKWKCCPVCQTPRPTKLTKKQQAIETYHKNCAEGGTY